MVEGASLHIGLNAVDPDHYDGWNGPLQACEQDAKDMHFIANSLGYVSRLLLTNEATSQAVVRMIDAAADALKTGDIFFLSLSGHGSRIPDVNGDESLDRKDETWCLFDRMLIDDELYGLLAQFKPGVRIIVLSDSCHSGTVVRDMEALNLEQLPKVLRQYQEQGPTVQFRILPEDLAMRVYRRHRMIYNALQFANRPSRRAHIRASVILISACQDNQLAADGVRNGLFTSKLLEVWGNGEFKGNHRELYRSILRRMPPTQTPNYLQRGRRLKRFADQRPFTI